MHAPILARVGGNCLTSSPPARPASRACRRRPWRRRNLPSMALESRSMAPSVSWLAVARVNTPWRTRARPESRMADDVKRPIAALERMIVGRLQAGYAEVFGETARSGHRRWLFRRIAWRPQALAEGEFSERARQRARERALDADHRVRRDVAHGVASGVRAKARAPSPRPTPRTPQEPNPRGTSGV